MIGPFEVIDAKNHVIAMDRDCILNTIYIVETRLVRAKAHVATKIGPNHNPSAHTTVLHDKDMQYKKPSECMFDEVVNHHHTAKALIYWVRWIEYSRRKYLGTSKAINHANLPADIGIYIPKSREPFGAQVCQLIHI